MPDIPPSLPLLVVEDNPVNQQVTMGLLTQRLGAKVDLAEDGLAAIAKFKRSTYGLILMDCQMPRCDGFEATRAIRKIESAGSRRIPIIALTAQALAGDREQCLTAGMDDYLTKPVDADRLIATVRSYLGPVRPESGLHKAVVPPASTDAQGALPLLDQDVVKSILACGAEATQEIYGVMVTELQQRRNQMANAIVLGDARTLASVAHSLKGASGTVGARQLEAICRTLESCGKSGDLAKAKQLWSEADRILTASTEAIAAVSTSATAT